MTPEEQKEFELLEEEEKALEQLKAIFHEEANKLWFEEKCEDEELKKVLIEQMEQVFKESGMTAVQMLKNRDEKLASQSIVGDCTPDDSKKPSIYSSEQKEQVAGYDHGHQYPKVVDVHAGETFDKPSVEGFNVESKKEPVKKKEVVFSEKKSYELLKPCFVYHQTSQGPDMMVEKAGFIAKGNMITKAYLEEGLVREVE